MTQLNWDYIVSGKYLQKKSTGLLSLGESLFNLPLAVAEVFLVLNKGSGS